MQHSRIRNKWTTVEQEILEEYFDVGKSAVEFRKWLEAMEDPKPGKQKDGSEDLFQDFEVRMGMIETV